MMKYKKLWLFLTALSGCLLIITLIIGLVISNETRYQSNLEKITTYDKSMHHLMFILNKNDQAYGADFMMGIEEASEAYNIAKELVMISEENYLEEVLDRLDMAIYSKVDGIVLHAYSHPEIIDKINQATEMGIPVITLNQSVHESKRLAYVGNNRFDVGVEVGKTISRLSGDYGNVAVVDRIMSDAGLEMMGLLSQGMKDVFSNHEALNLVTTQNTSQGVLSAENITVNILREYPQVDIIYSTDGQNTLGIVQVLIDQNKINDIIVVGTSDHIEILNYIQEGGAVDATLITDYYALGYGVVETYGKYVSDGSVSGQMTPKITVVDATSIEAYLEQLEAFDEAD